MCYDLKQQLHAQLKRAKRFYPETVKEIEDELQRYRDNPLVSGFAHPKLLIYSNKEPFRPVQATWGLVPSWVKDRDQLIKTWNTTINARGESIFEKPSFRESAKSKRCLIYIDGFYEHYHFKGKTYPYFIHKIDNEPLPIAGLWNDWTDQQTGEIMKTFTIVTTKANKLMSKIHNNPKIPEPRMPVILYEDTVDEWLNRETEKGLTELLQPFSDELMDAHTVRRIKGKEAIGNVPEASQKFDYSELNQGSLF